MYHTYEVLLPIAAFAFILVTWLVFGADYSNEKKFWAAYRGPWPLVLLAVGYIVHQVFFAD